MRRKNWPLGRARHLLPIELLAHPRMSKPIFQDSCNFFARAITYVRKSLGKSCAFFAVFLRARGTAETAENAETAKYKFGII